MPNRIIKESVCTSDEINALKWFEEVLFYRLIVNCDDFGRYDGRYMIIKNSLFPLKESVTVKNIEDAVNRLVSVGLVDYYFVDRKPFLQLRTWDSHQQIRAKRSKYPANCNQMISNDINCNQMISNVPVIQSNPIQSESESNTKEKRAPARKKYGEYQNVLLSDEEYAKLKSDIPNVDGYIEKLSSYMASKGKKYSNHKATISNWYKRDKEEGKTNDGQTTVGGSFDTDEFFERSLKRTMEQAKKLMEGK